jgi:hypothetical protein
VLLLLLLLRGLHRGLLHPPSARASAPGRPSTLRALAGCNRLQQHSVLLPQGGGGGAGGRHEGEGRLLWLSEQLPRIST